MATRTSRFGVGRRESHDSSPFYGRRFAGKHLSPVQETRDTTVGVTSEVNRIYVQSAESMPQVSDDSVALMVTSPPYFAGKDYDSEGTFDEYLEMLRAVFAETYRKLQPGGRAVVNLANLGRRPYIPLTHLVGSLMLDIGYLMRGEIIWQKAKGASGNCAWGSWMSPANPVIRDVHEYCLCFSKGRFDRVIRGAPTVTKEEFLESTLSVWEIPPESASRARHPAPFPVELPRRFIQLYTYEGDLVLDPFLGSGTTAVAAEESGRTWIGYETSEEYARIARERIEELKAC
jgi:site-specific DNA-methyltransferase (adenine-specific)